jgi:prepilin-type N-terminal cleavage/methylation domain-containing protein
MMDQISQRRGVTLVELIVVLVIILGVIGLLFPAINGVRESARAATCRNNLHQLRLAMRQYLDTNQDIPNGNGWTVSLLPYVEEASTMTAIRNGDDDAPRPAVYVCPSHPGFDSNESKIHPSLYALVISESGQRTLLRMVDRATDLPTTQLSPWSIGPELTQAEAVDEERRMMGPHRAGRFQASPWLTIKR